MARNQHKKDLINLAEAYGSILNGGHDEREQLDEIAPLVAAGLGALAGGVIADDEEAGTREVEHIDLSQWWKYEPHEVIQQVMWRNRVVKGSDHDEAKIWANIEPKLNSKWPRPAEDGEFNLRDVNPGDTLFGDRRGKREESEEDKTGHLSDEALLHKVEGMGTAGDRLLDSAKKRVGAGESLTDSERTALARDAYGKAEKDIAHDKKSEDFEDTTHGF